MGAASHVSALLACTIDHGSSAINSPTSLTGARRGGFAALSCIRMFTAAPRCIMVEQQGAQGRYRDGVEEMECDLPHETITVASRDSKIQAEVIEGSSQSGCAKSRKRGREIEEEEESSREVEKRGCEEGMSWWTCLMLGISQERTQPQVVKKIYKK